jgi:hypothetical protein
LKEHLSLAATRIIALSATAMRRNAEIDALFHRVLVKPCHADALREAIDGRLVPDNTR